jgi:two-component system sensor histidine kinase KdpD
MDTEALNKKHQQLEQEKAALTEAKIKIQAQKRVMEMTVAELMDDKKKLRQKENRLSESVSKLENINNNLILWQRALLHEQKNMFTEIYNQIYHIKTDPSDENLENAVRKTEIIEREINNLLKWSRDFVIKTEPEYSTFNFKSLIDRFDEVYEKYSKNKEIIVRPEIFQIHSDRNLMKFIINNLLKNVLNIVRSKARIEINIQRSEKEYHFELTDNGPGFHGFPPDEEIFKKVKKGTGLMVTERCIEILKGTIELRNMPSGGAKYNFSFPVEAASKTEENNAQ